MVGTAAAIANAVYHATCIRVRDLPTTFDRLLRVDVQQRNLRTARTPYTPVLGPPSAVI
jgi:hypothetical protein